MMHLQEWVHAIAALKWICEGEEAVAIRLDVNSNMTSGLSQTGRHEAAKSTHLNSTCRRIWRRRARRRPLATPALTN